MGNSCAKADPNSPSHRKFNPHATPPAAQQTHEPPRPNTPHIVPSAGRIPAAQPSTAAPLNRNTSHVLNSPNNTQQQSLSHAAYLLQPTKSPSPASKCFLTLSHSSLFLLSLLPSHSLASLSNSPRTYMYMANNDLPQLFLRQITSYK